jgi:hypothetical protein
LVLADANQALAAESEFQSDPPQRGGAGMMFLRLLFNHHSELMDQQLKNLVYFDPLKM